MSPDLPSFIVAAAVAFLLIAANADGGQHDGSGDRSALLQFKAAVASDPGGLLSLWSGSDHCSWPGVSCDSTSRVISLNISGRGDVFTVPCFKSGPLRRSCSDPGRRLTGALSPAIGRLSELTVLSLPFHGFSGEFPGGIFGLKNLVMLNLEESLITGTLPYQFPSSLRVLNFRSNLIRGEIPPSLSSCVNLEILDLSGNQLNGSVPRFLRDFPNLRGLYLSFNRLGGSIPYEIGSNCHNLEHLDLSGNILVGAIPRSLGSCSQLQSLLLFSNLLDGFVPPDLGSLQKLRVLDVSRNSLSGSVPAELGNCRELSVLVLVNLYDASPGGEYSTYVDNGEYNYFQGGLAENITRLPNLRILWAPNGMFEGPIPNNWGACQSLEMVNLGQNLFTGSLPTVFSRCKNLRFLNLSSNKLAGWINEDLQVPCMDVFDVSGNWLSGSIPRFTYKQCPTLQFSLDDLPAAYSSFFTYRAHAGISLPSLGMGNDHTMYHNFGGNNFTGPLPALLVATERFGNQTLYVLLADRNKLQGSFSGVLFDKCKDLKMLIANFTNNMISGGIPAEVGSLCRPLVVLDAARNQITGTMPESLGLLDNLVVLDLSGNRLQGQIPESFGELKALSYLSLANNNLSGHIPASFDWLHSLKVLDLSYNSLSGEISGGLVNLKNLTVLLLDHNRLSGQIPYGFSGATSLGMFNASFNNLSGPLPINASMVRCDAVLGNPLIQPCSLSSLSTPPSYLRGRIGDYQGYTNPPPASLAGKSSGGGFSSIEIASITSAAAIVSVLLALIILYLYTKKCMPRSSVWSSGSREVTIFTDIGVPVTYESVVRATGNFNASNCIGSGGFGATYKAEISPGVLVAIKKLSIGRFQGLQQFHAEIKTLGRWRHPNLVTLIGYHVSDSEMFLIYNYLPGGNLERFIHERSKRAVDWKMLHKIALDVAYALAYLHDECVPRILHRDVKPSNILLDIDLNAYLSDFGLARLLGNSETHATTGVAGTFGYVAPEYAMTCRVSDKADVYSYGVVLLELISDKKALDPSFSPYGNGFNIVAWACMLLRQGRAHEFFIEGLWGIGPHDDLVEALQLGVMCTVDSLSIRPTMKQVVQRLKQLQPTS